MFAVRRQQTGEPARSGRPGSLSSGLITRSLCVHKRLFLNLRCKDLLRLTFSLTKCVCLNQHNPSVKSCQRSELRRFTGMQHVVNNGLNLGCVYSSGGGRMDDTHIIRYGTRGREGSTREAGNTRRHTPRTGNTTHLSFIITHMFFNRPPHINTHHSGYD